MNLVKNLRKFTSGLPGVGGFEDGVILLNVADGTLSFPNAQKTSWHTISTTGSQSGSGPAVAFEQYGFVANGTQASFQTSATNPNPADYIVSLAGITQYANVDFTLNAGAIVFATPPPSTAKINVLVARNSGGSSFAVNQFVFAGNGTQVLFQTTSTSSTAAHFIVSVGGVVQTAGIDFSVNAGGVTFDVAPELNERINILVASGGIAGPQGSIGPAGAQGVQGEKGDAGTSFTFVGVYSSQQTYQIGNVVRFEDSTTIGCYVRKNAAGSESPLDSTKWDAMIVMPKTYTPPVTTGNYYTSPTGDRYVSPTGDIYAQPV